jgi:hypothetical protein
MSKEVVFWQKALKPFSSEFELVACEAKNLGTSTKVCVVCNEPEQGHGKRGRKHGFMPNSNVGLSLEVTYAGNPGKGQTVELHNVQQGKEANCYTEAK